MATSAATNSPDPRVIMPGHSTAAAGAAFIVNRSAGAFARDPGLERAVREAVRGRGSVHVTESLPEVEEAARQVIAHRASPVVLCGGDGTYLAGVTALARAANGALPPIVLARGGTVSIVARNFSRSRGLLKTVRDVAERPSSFTFVPRPTLRVEAEGVTRIGFTFGTGLVANFFDEYERAGAGGNKAALGIVLRVFVDSLRGGPMADRILTPLPCRIVADDAVLEPEAWSLVLASVLRDVGLHMIVAHRAGEDRTRPHLVASPLLPRALGPQWPRVALGRPLEGAGNFDGLVSSFRVEFSTDRGRYVLDGDTFRSKAVTVSAGPVVRIAL